MWFTERQTTSLGLSLKVRETLYRARSEYQEIAVLDTEQYGRMLVLDGMVQTTVSDEFVYHEMISHVPMRTHPHAQDILVIGGGDGGVVRELCRYPNVTSVTLVEIDGDVVEAARRFLPEISLALDDPRVEVRITDGIKFASSVEDSYDIIIIDSTEPMGPAEGLFNEGFYRDIFNALKTDGLVVAQTESPFVNASLINRVFRFINSIFPVCHLYLAPIPTYPSGLWSFTMGSKHYSPLSPAKNFLPKGIKYYTPDVHFSSFSLPVFVQELLSHASENTEGED